jgi:hypothetical protein
MVRPSVRTFRPWACYHIGIDDGLVWGEEVTGAALDVFAVFD